MTATGRHGTATSTNAVSTRSRRRAWTCTAKPTSSCGLAPSHRARRGLRHRPGRDRARPARVSTSSGSTSTRRCSRRPRAWLGRRVDASRPHRPRPRPLVRCRRDGRATSRSSRRPAPTPRSSRVAPVTSARAAHSSRGFQLGRGYSLAEYDADCRAAGSSSPSATPPGIATTRPTRPTTRSRSTARRDNPRHPIRCG